MCIFFFLEKGVRNIINSILKGVLEQKKDEQSTASGVDHSLLMKRPTTLLTFIFLNKSFRMTRNDSSVLSTSVICSII